MGNELIDNQVNKDCEEYCENMKITDLEEWPIYVQLKTFLSETDSQELKQGKLIIFIINFHQKYMQG